MPLSPDRRVLLQNLWNGPAKPCQLMSTSIFLGRKMPSPSRSVETWKNQNHATIGRSSTISLLRVTSSPGNKESTCHLHVVHFSMGGYSEWIHFEGYPWSWYLISLIFLEETTHIVNLEFTPTPPTFLSLLVCPGKHHQRWRYAKIDQVSSMASCR